MKLRFSLVLLLALSSACGQSNPPGASGSSSSPAGTNRAASQAVVARVNGAPITEADVELKMQAPMHEAAPMPAEEKKKAVLDNIIGREVMAQRALSLGLDQDPKYQDDLKKLEAQVADFKRTALSELLLRKEGEKRTPTDDEARAYFTKNEKRLRMQLHVLQILKRSEAEIVEARSMIERGKSFEDVAASYFPNLPQGQTPWDLGYLPFYKIPEPWRETVYDMKNGEMSGVLRGPSDRYWLVKLIDVREDTAMTFESAKEAVLQDMKANKVQHAREGLEKELRATAKIEIVGK